MISNFFTFLASFFLTLAFAADKKNDNRKLVVPLMVDRGGTIGATATSGLGRSGWRVPVVT